MSAAITRHAEISARLEQIDSLLSAGQLMAEMTGCPPANTEDLAREGVVLLAELTALDASKPDKRFVARDGIAEIDGLFVPFSVTQEDVGPRGTIHVTTYWGWGYLTARAARRAMSRTEQGHDTPPGCCRVNIRTGERAGIVSIT